MKSRSKGMLARSVLAVYVMNRALEVARVEPAVARSLGRVYWLMWKLVVEKLTFLVVRYE